MIRASKVVGYVEAMRKRGISLRRLLAGTGIDATLLCNPSHHISFGQYHAVVSNMIAATDDKGIAFSLGDIGKVKDFGLVGYAMLSASSLMQAIQTWMEYSNSLVGTLTNFRSCQKKSPGYELTLTSTSPYMPMQRFETEELLVQGLRGIRDLTGVTPVIKSLSLAYPEPAHRRLYDKTFKCPLHFNAAKTVWWVLNPELTAPIQSRDEEVFALCAEHCREVMRLDPEAGVLHTQLRSIFLSRPHDLPDLKDASVAFGMSVSTLRRKLEADGLSYQDLKDRFRFDLARAYLKSGHMAPKQIGYLLGFSTPSVFSRAFKSWSGKTVGQFVGVRKRNGYSRGHHSRESTPNRYNHPLS